MADTPRTTPPSNGDKVNGPRPISKQQRLNELYSLPAPLRTFPLPTLVPHNPLSLFHILYVWLSQTIRPEPSHHKVLFQGWFSPETRSVHVTDLRSIRGLWEQGFYGKGSLSRSEPSWLEREKKRKGTNSKKTSEEATRKRRAERQQTKWERARKEREAIDQKRLEEAAAEAAQELKSDDIGDVHVNASTRLEKILPALSSPALELLPPVGPTELLLLPNSSLDLQDFIKRQSVSSCTVEDFDDSFITRFYSAPVGPLELLALPNSINPRRNASGNLDTEQSVPASPNDNLITPDVKVNGNGHAVGTVQDLKVEESELVGGSETNDDTAEGSTHSEDTADTNITTPTRSTLANGSLLAPGLKRRKSVRFSPTVEKNTFIQTEPPSPDHASSKTTIEEQPTIEEQSTVGGKSLVIRDQEHTQLTLEEAFFLSYGLGALEILDPETKLPISIKELFTLFRKTSYFPPVVNQSLSPDDPFMINYVVYHHYRSLGWVPRSGVKFSVDLMLYVRGPVFTHAEFAVIILPSYSHSYWSSDVFLQKYVKSKEQRTWAWLSCINRVIAQVKKTLILAYVDIPPPLDKGEEEGMPIDEVLGRYKIREVVMKRWVANRSRDIK